MSQPGTDDRPLRVAIIGAGPTGFYAADHLLKQKGHVVEVDLFDRVPTPYGLVRAGVAPDHQKIKSVTARLRQGGGASALSLLRRRRVRPRPEAADLRRHYHQIVYTTGAQTDRRMGIPGEDLKGSHPATEFVAWYNGHPDYRDPASTSRRSAPRWSASATSRWTSRASCAAPPTSWRRRTSPTTRWRRCARAASRKSTCSAGAARPRRPSPTPRSGSWASWPTPT